MTHYVSDEHVSHQRWSLNNGLINDLHKDTLYMYGAVAHPEVKASETAIDVDKKVITYDIYLPREIIKQHNKFCALKQSTSIFGLWRFKRMLEKGGNLDFLVILDTFVKDYCGPDWRTVMTIKDFAKYTDGFDQGQINGESAEGQDSDKLPD